MFVTHLFRLGRIVERRVRAVDIDALCIVRHHHIGVDVSLAHNLTIAWTVISTRALLGKFVVQPYDCFIADVMRANLAPRAHPHPPCIGLALVARSDRARNLAPIDREMEAAVQIAVVGCSQRSPVAGALIGLAGSLGGTRTSLRELRFGAADGLPAGSMEMGDRTSLSGCASGQAPWCAFVRYWRGPSSATAANITQSFFANSHFIVAPWPLSVTAIPPTLSLHQKLGTPSGRMSRGTFTLAEVTFQNGKSLPLARGRLEATIPSAADCGPSLSCQFTSFQVGVWPQ